MRIKFEPTYEVAPGVDTHTPVGFFVPGEVVDVGDAPATVAAARRLVQNGDFVETDEDPNSDEIRQEWAEESNVALKERRREIDARATGEEVTESETEEGEEEKPKTKKASAPAKPTSAKRSRKVAR